MEPVGGSDLWLRAWSCCGTFPPGSVDPLLLHSESGQVVGPVACELARSIGPRPKPKGKRAGSWDSRRSQSCNNGVMTVEIPGNRPRGLAVLYQHVRPVENFHERHRARLRAE